MNIRWCVAWSRTLWIKFTRPRDHPHDESAELVAQINIKSGLMEAQRQNWSKISCSKNGEGGRISCLNKTCNIARYYCINRSAVWVTMKICDKCTNCELTLKPNIQSTELTSHFPQVSMIAISFFPEVQSQYHSAVRSRAINMPPSIARHILASHNLLTRCWRANISPEHMISSPESHNFHLQTCSPMGPGRISPTLCLLIWPTSAQQGKKFSLPNYLVWVACHCVTKYPPS